MKKQEIHIIKLLLKTKKWKKIELKRIVIKYILKNLYVNNLSKHLILLKIWNLKKFYFISNQTNVCKLSGTYKKTFDQIGLNRHSIRNLCNTNKIPHLKKLSW